MGREKSAPVTPKQRPDLLRIRPWNVQRRNLARLEKRKLSFPMRRRQALQTRLDLEQKHQPVRRSLKTMLADDACQM